MMCKYYFKFIYIFLFVKIVFSKTNSFDQLINYTKIIPYYFDINLNQVILQKYLDSSNLDLNKIQYIKLCDDKKVLYELKVFVNNNFLSDNFFVKYQSNGKYLFDYNKKYLNDLHFHGYVITNSSQKSILNSNTLALTLFNQNLSGAISFFKENIFIFYDELSNQHYLFKKKIQIENNDFYFNIDLNKPSNQNKSKFSREKRSTNKIFGSFQKDENYRYVELYLVIDNKEFTNYSNNTDKLTVRSKGIINLLNKAFNQLNIYIILVGIEIWAEHDKIILSTNGNETLTKFLQYRKDQILPIHYNDNAQLITGVLFRNYVVGKALKGTICTREFSGGVNTDHNEFFGYVANTISHELGHNFGIEHDGVNCECPEKICIMSNESSNETPQFWSSCSIQSFKNVFDHGMDSCLKNLPSKTFSAFCGNEILEEGEECDCGLSPICKDCCNDCKLRDNALCGTGICCNLQTCKPYTKEDKKSCRKSKGICDLQENCDGISEFCPQDIYVYNGIMCKVENEESYCFDGDCFTHKSQCKKIFGPTAKVSIDRCYEENANNASQAANCGVEYDSHGKKRYKTCKKADIFCGRLHCLHQNEKLEFGLESAATQSLITNGTIICRSAEIDLGNQTQDPGLVANGVKCGINKMCVNQKCVPLKNEFCWKNCNNNGICNSLGECTCFPGFNPPYCKKPISLIYFVLFLIILFLIGIYLLYHYYEKIKTWISIKFRIYLLRRRAMQETYKSRDKRLSNKNKTRDFQLDLRNLEISSPIPQSQCKT